MRGSAGLNLGMDFLPGALPFDPGVRTAAIRSSPPTSSGSTR